MKHTRRRLLSTALAVALGAMPPSFVGAEDIDLFVGGNPVAAANRPNVLIILDNSANWAAANQGWPGGVKQGESELRSLRTVAGEVTDRVNLGLMLFTPGSGGTNKDGSYVRYHVRQMTATNKAALQELIGDASCVNGPNSLNGTPNCLFKNFNDPTEKTATANTDYSAGLFEAFKYFGGYTNPANAQTGIAGTPVSASQFGPLRYAGDPEPKSDPAAFAPSTQRTTYNPPINATNNCAKNYIIFIGNGFPAKDAPSTLLSGIQGSTAQIPMPQFTTTSTVQTATIGTQCATGANATQRKNNCEAAIPQSLKDANPADSYTCINERTSATCTGSPDPRLFDVQSSKTVITVTPTGTSALPGSEARFTDEWAKYLFTTDVNGAAGQQNIVTYAIDVFKDAQDARQTALLFNMAKQGGGRYFQASSEDAILRALRDILVEIQAVNSVFASASLPISATNRSQNENQVFIGMFRPDADGRPRWYGNLKRYQIALFGGEAKLADKDGLEAVSTATGFVQACAASFWTTDSSTYWDFSPNSAGQCTASTTSVFSDLPDGPLVEKGAAAEVLRKGNDPAAVTPTFAVNRTINTCTNTSTCSAAGHLVPFNAGNVSKTQLGDASMSNAVRDGIIDYTRGQDVNNENANANPDGTANVTDVRSSVHGDVAHSRPLPVNYGGATGVVVYYGANDGTFRAVSGDSGKELWAFIAPEHHGKLKRLTNNSPFIQYPNTPAGVTPTPAAKDYFFDGSTGLFQTFDDSTTPPTVTRAWIFPTMRRGGRALYAFDVTTPTLPKLKWRKGCPNLTDDSGCTNDSTGDFTGIGQTWSFPNVARIRGFNSGNDPVLIMGGGYDACEDADTSTPSCGGAKGRKVYVINANDGALIRSFDTDRSVVGDVTLIDRDFDGLVDHAYVADTGGNLYRIDFVNPTTLVAFGATSGWTITKIAFTTGGGRKFQLGPAALPGANRVFLALGSGDRERPLETNYPFTTGVSGVQNRFYMFIDTFAAGAVDLDVNLRDFTDINACATSLNSSDRGWRMDLNSGRGEQTVTSAVIFGGLVFFSTNRPVSTPPGACAANLGEARGYAVNLLNASGAVGTAGLCGAGRSGIFVGGGLPPSPVTGTVSIGGKPVTVMIGGIQREGGASSPIGAQKVKPVIAQKRSRVYWYTQGDK